MISRGKKETRDRQASGESMNEKTPARPLDANGLICDDFFLSVFLEWGEKESKNRRRSIQLLR